MSSNNVIRQPGFVIKGSQTTTRVKQSVLIDVPTTTSEALILKTTDDNTTKNLFEVQDSSGNKVASIGPQGHLVIGSTDPTAGTGAFFNKTVITDGVTTDHRATNSQMFANVNHSSVSLFGGFYDARQNFGSTGAFQVVGIRGTAQNITSNVAGFVTGGDFTVTASGSGGASNLWGFRGTALASGTNTATPIGANLFAQRSSTSASNAKGLNIIVQALSTGNIGDGWGAYIQSATKAAGATFTNNYGLYIENQTAAATLNYGAYLAGGSTETLHIETGTTTAIGVVIKAAASQTANLTNWTDSSDNVLVSIENDGILNTASGRIKNTTRVTTTYTILVTDDVVFANTDGGAYTATLPAGAEGQTFKIINSGSTGLNLTLAPDGSEHLLGANSNFVLADGETLVITYNATDGWY